MSTSTNCWLWSFKTENEEKLKCIHISKLYLIISNNCWLWSFNTENEEKLRCIQEKKTWLIGLFRREDATSYTGFKVCAPLINPIFTSQGRNQPLAYISVTWPSPVGIGLRCLCRPVWKIQILAVLDLFSTGYLIAKRTK